MSALWGTVAAVFSVLTLVPQRLELNVGMGALFLHRDINAQPSHAGRAGPNVALDLAYPGVSLVMMRTTMHINAKRVVAEMCGLLVFTLGLAALIGYLSGLRSVYRWGNFTNMAVYIAIGCMVVGLGIIGASWRMERSGDEATRPWLPTLAGFAVAVISLLLWQGLLGREYRQFRHLIHQQTAIVQDDVTSEMALRISPLLRMATLWEQQGRPHEAVWRIEAQYDVMHMGGYWAIAWVDPSLQVRWIVPAQGNEALLHQSLAYNSRQRQGLELAREQHVATATPPGELLPGLTGFQVAVPIATGETFRGWIVGFFHAQKLFDLLFKNAASNFSLALFINDEEFYGRYDESREYEEEWGQDTVFSFHGVPWRVRVWPRPGPLTETFSPLPDLVLAAGMVTAMLLMVSVHFGQTARLGVRQVERSNRELQNEIAEHRQTGQALQASHRFLQAILDALPAHMAILDGAGVIVAVNAAWRRFVTAHDMALEAHGLGLNYLGICEAIVGSDGAVVKAISTGIRDVMAHQRDAFHHEYAFPNPGEVQHWFLMHVTRFDSQEGDRVVVTHENITEVKRAEAELQRQRDALYQTEKLAVMGSLMAGVAHELNNPLAAVLVQADLLREEAEEGPLAEQAQTLAQGIERCVNVVRTFLAFARQQPPQRVSVALNAVVEEALALLSYSLRMDEIEVELRLADDLPALWADPHLLHQVVVNLAANAHQALRDTSPPRHLTISTYADATGTRVILEVADTGPGIAAELQDQIFEPFFTTKPAGVGTGIGLSFCQGIVESHGGAITVQSQLGQGAVFQVELPVESVPVLAAVEPLSPRLAAVRNAAILVVDDENGIRRALARLLRRDGHEVDTAANGRLALEMLQERTYDLILCDWRMPELDGPGLYHELERHLPHLLRGMIFLTGDVLTPETQTFLDRSSGLYLHKPFNAATCRQVIGQALQRLQER